MQQKANKKLSKELTIPILLLGDSTAGKTSIVNRFMHNIFIQNTTTTLGFIIDVKTVEVDGFEFNLKIYDSSGQDRFDSYTTQQIRQCKVFFCVFDLTQNISFLKIKTLVEKVQGFYKDDDQMKIFLIGSKLDMCIDEDNQQKRDVTYEDALSYAQENCMDYYEISSKTSDNFFKMFEQISQKLSLKFILPIQRQKQTEFIQRTDSAEQIFSYQEQPTQNSMNPQQIKTKDQSIPQRMSQKQKESFTLSNTKRQNQALDSKSTCC